MHRGAVLVAVGRQRLSSPDLPGGRPRSRVRECRRLPALRHTEGDL
jgi:hypothetical protein